MTARALIATGHSLEVIFDTYLEANGIGMNLVVLAEVIEIWCPEAVGTGPRPMTEMIFTDILRPSYRYGKIPTHMRDDCESGDDEDVAAEFGNL